MTNGYDDPMAGPKDQWTIEDWAAYTSFGRVLFTCALAGISVLNCSDNGGVVQGFLTLSFWEPVGKLTYGAYLIHPTVLRVYFYQLTQLYQVRMRLDIFTEQHCVCPWPCLFCCTVVCVAAWVSFIMTHFWDFRLCSLRPSTRHTHLLLRRRWRTVSPWFCLCSSSFLVAGLYQHCLKRNAVEIAPVDAHLSRTKLRRHF